MIVHVEMAHPSHPSIEVTPSPGIEDFFDTRTFPVSKKRVPTFENPQYQQQFSTGFSMGGGDLNVRILVKSRKIKVVLSLFYLLTSIGNKSKFNLTKFPGCRITEKSA